jgi:hypothetical protein
VTENQIIYDGDSSDDPDNPIYKYFSLKEETIEVDLKEFKATETFAVNSMIQGNFVEENKVE